MRTVKRISPILAIAWVCLGMATAQDALQRRSDGLWYLADAEQPYTGMTKRKHFDGTRISEISYRNGKQHGPTKFWYNTGKPRSVFHFSDGKLDGNSTYYYKGDGMQNLTTYRAGVLHGPTIDWWPNGKKSFEENYDNGIPNGVWRGWWPDGKLASEKIYRNRSLVARREWTREGMPKQLTGWNLNGMPRNAASQRAHQQTVGRRMAWNRVSGPNRIDLIYRDKPLRTIRTVFGDPDATNDRRWTYKGLRIQDPTDNKMYDTVIFSFKKGKVAEIWIE